MKSLFLFTVLILATIVAHPTAHAEGDKLACETALVVRIGPEELDKHCAECVLAEKALSPKLVQVSEATSLPISADADFLRIAVLLKKSQIGTYSQLNFFEAQISNAKLKVSAQKMLVELYQAFAKDFDGESIRNATRITELTQRRDALMLAMQTATPDPKVNAEYMEVAYEVAIRKTIPKTLEDLTKYKSMIPTTNTDAETELKQLESLTNNLNISKLTDPEAIYIYNLYLDYSMKLKTVKSRPEFTDCGLTDSELFAIYFYTMNGYRRLNESLRSPGLDSETNELIRLTSNGLFKLKKYEGIVHRGENVRADRLERMKVGNEIDFPTFTSTSKAEGFMKSNKLNMHSKEGRYIAPLSDIRSEEEVLFMPNSRFRVTEVKGTEIMLEQVVDGAPTLRPK